MIEYQIFAWFVVMIPLVFSAGPANITLAAFGARFGFLNSLPFITGVSTIVFFQALLAGFGMNQFLETYPRFFNLLQIGGALYLVYLAFIFFKSSQAESSDINISPTFKDGIVLQTLNIKGVMMAAVMFSQFLNNGAGQLLQVGILSVGLVVIGTVAMITWTIGGAWLVKTFSPRTSFKLQRYLFGSMLLGVAASMLF